jgi:hypothetical protein
MTPEYFRDHKSIFARAAQAYQILVGDAMDGRIVTYEKTGDRMKSMPMLGETLDRIAAWTKERDLPDLSAIVVNKDSGQPGNFGEPGVHPYAITLEQWPGVLADVRKTDWFAVVPPTAKEIEQAWERFVAQRRAA